MPKTCILQTRALLDDPENARSTQRRFEALESMRAEALGEHQLTVESCDNREQDMRNWLQARIDAEDKQARSACATKSSRPWPNIKEEFKLETAEVDASIEAALRIPQNCS